MFHLQSAFLTLVDNWKWYWLWFWQTIGNDASVIGHVLDSPLYFSFLWHVVTQRHDFLYLVTLKKLKVKSIILRKRFRMFWRAILLLIFFYTCEKNILIKVTFKPFYSFFLFSLVKKRNNRVNSNLIYQIFALAWFITQFKSEMWGHDITIRGT